jgi:hypothetical protein
MAGLVVCLAAGLAPGALPDGGAGDTVTEWGIVSWQWSVVLAARRS